jgi:hypothetical protein
MSIVAEYFARAGGFERAIAQTRTPLDHLGDPLYGVFARVTE